MPIRRHNGRDIVGSGRQYRRSATTTVTSSRIALRDVNWLGDRPLSDEGMAVAVKIRSAHGPVPATLFGKSDGGGEVLFDTPERAVAPGQACVFYAGSRVLGGGFIRREG